MTHEQGEQVIKESDYWEREDPGFVVEWLRKYFDAENLCFWIPIEGEGDKKEYLNPSQVWSRFSPPPPYRFWEKAEPHSIEITNYVKRSDEIEIRLFRYIIDEVGWDLRKDGIHTDW